jgi:hypothetical protein
MTALAACARTSAGGEPLPRTVAGVRAEVGRAARRPITPASSSFVEPRAPQRAARAGPPQHESHRANPRSRARVQPLNEANGIRRHRRRLRTRRVRGWPQSYAPSAERLALQVAGGVFLERGQGSSRRASKAVEIVPTRVTAFDVVELGRTRGRVPTEGAALRAWGVRAPGPAPSGRWRARPAR